MRVVYKKPAFITKAKPKNHGKLGMFIVEGNIGVGKSTFLEGLRANFPNLEIVPEPKDDWTQVVGGESLLDNFYQNPQRWAYTMETLALMRRAWDYQSLQPTRRARVLERSMYSGHYCFAKNGFEQNYFSPLEWRLYNEWASFIFSRCTLPRGFIYLRANPQVCYDRMLRRNRESESSLSLDYMQKIHDLHDAFLLEKQQVSASIAAIPTLVLDCNTDFIDDHQIIPTHRQALESFFASLKNSENSFDF